VYAYETPSWECIFSFPRKEKKRKEKEGDTQIPSVKRSDITYARFPRAFAGSRPFGSRLSVSKVARYLSNKRYSKRVSILSVLSSTNHHVAYFSLEPKIRSLKGRPPISGPALIGSIPSS
jgi:hypothetical protein